MMIIWIILSVFPTDFKAEQWVLIAAQQHNTVFKTEKQTWRKVNLTHAGWMKKMTVTASLVHRRRQNQR